MDSGEVIHKEFVELLTKSGHQETGKKRILRFDAQAPYRTLPGAHAMDQWSFVQG